MECEKRPNILSDTIHDASWQRIQEIEKPREPIPEAEAPVFQTPQFTQPLQSQADVPENSVVVFEGRLIPVGDPSLSVQVLNLSRLNFSIFGCLVVFERYSSSTIKSPCYYTRFWLCRSSYKRGNFIR